MNYDTNTIHIYAPSWSAQQIRDTGHLVRQMFTAKLNNRADWIVSNVSSKMADKIEAGVYVMYKIYTIICCGSHYDEDYIITPEAMRSELWEALCVNQAARVERQGELDHVQRCWSIGIGHQIEDTPLTLMSEQGTQHDECFSDSGMIEEYHRDSLMVVSAQSFRERTRYLSRSSRGSLVSSPTGSLTSFHELENCLSEDDACRVEDIYMGREIPDGASGYPLQWSTSRAERQQLVSPQVVLRRSGIEGGQDKEHEAKKFKGPTTNTDSFAGKGD